MKPLAVVTALLVLLSATACTGGDAASPAATSPSVVEGEPGPDETEPMEPDPDPELLPWEGGTFTWPNGIQVKTSVELLEPIWQKKVEFCDGCLTLVQKDINFALRYTVTVPKSFRGTLDTARCEGSLTVDSGNDDETFTAHLGENSRGLTGQMRPGSTKYGVEQWGIKRAARNTGFVYSNSCGDVEGSGLGGTWGGKLPAFTTPQPASMFKEFKGTYFAVKVGVVRQHKDGFAVMAQACLLRDVPGFDGYVPSTLDPWTVTAGGKAVKGDGDDERTTYDTDAVLSPGDDFGACNSGWIFFPTKAPVSQIRYANSLGEKGSWPTAP